MKSTLIIVLFLLDLPGNALFCKDFRVLYVFSEMTECGKSEQNLASYYFLLVVKLVAKRKGLLLRIFFIILAASLGIPIIQISMSFV